ncbi:MAG: DUF4230 domain-containing protein [Pseudomonadota bacterium]
MEGEVTSGGYEHPANRRTWVWLAVGAIGVLALFFAYRSYQERQRREAALGSMVVAFQEQNNLSVFRAQVPQFVTSNQKGWIFSAEQFGIIPASVEYRLDLSKMNKSDFKWDSETKRMTVTIPPLLIGEPVLDMSRAKLVNKGILMRGDVALQLLKKNTISARQQSLNDAKNPQMMELARNAARKAMAQNISIPLRVAGYDDITVVARFPTDGTDEPTYLDRSLTYNQAIEARNRRAAQGK